MTISSSQQTSEAPSCSPHPSTAEAQEAIVKTISEETIRVCELRFGRTLRSLILSGSLARGEGSFTRDNESWQLLSDAEFILVLTDSARLPSADEERETRKKIINALSARAVHCSFSLALVHADFLRKLRPSIFAHELRTCGRVLWGDAAILSLVPRFAVSEIPLEDAWRLLCNRLVECLQIFGCLEQGCEPISPEAHYRIVKLYLDMCTSILVCCGTYEPSYSQRAAALRKLAQMEPAAVPFPLQEFSKKVSAATELKISVKGSKDFCAPHRKELASRTREAMLYARLLWRWELKKLTSSNDDVGDRELLERWMKRQTIARRLRGWAYVCRKQGWHRSWREWGRWLRLLCQASPRYCIYAAASEMCFVLPSLVDNTDAYRLTESLDCRRWSDSLPVRRKVAGSDPPQWPQLAAETLWNYQQFLVETRA